MNKDIPRTDLLALQRTKLANERTFLAYFRTFVVIFSSGIAIIKIDVLNNLIVMGYLFIAIAVFLIVIGIIRFFYVKKQINRYFKDEE